MTINLADNDPRVSYAVAAGATQSSFTVSFEFFADADLNVYVDGTLKTLTTDYTVTGGSGSTGSIAISVTGASGGSTVVITRSIALERTTDFPSSGPFDISSLNEELDKFISIAGDLKDKSDRALQLTDFDTNVSLTLPDVNTRKGTVLAFDSVTGAVVAGPQTGNVNTIAAIATDIANLADIEDGTVATDAISDTAAIASNVTTVAGISSNVTTVASISSDVTAVAADATDIGTVATDIANVNTVSTDIVNVNAVANNASNINAVAGNASNINTVSSNIANINGVNSNASNINTVAGNDANITTVAGISANVTTVAGISANVTTVAGDSADIGTLSAISSDITSLANALGASTTYVVTVVGGIYYLGGVANPVLTFDRGNTYIFDLSDSSNTGHPLAFKDGSGNSYTTGVTTTGTAGSSGAQVQIDVDNAAPASLRYYCTVHGNGMGNTITVVNSNLALVASNITSVNSVAGNATNINTAATNISGINTAANSISAINDFNDIFTASASAPSSPSEGDLWYDTTNSSLKVYVSGSFQVAGAYLQGLTSTHVFTATAAQTTFTTDDAGNTMSIFANGNTLVFLNGIRLIEGTSSSNDYYISGNNVILNSGAAVGDMVYVEVFTKVSTTQEASLNSLVSQAQTSATNAATSETNAATSASNASTSETNASSSASSASTSAATATSQASAASTSASNAATSESNAASSATAAAASANQAAASAGGGTLKISGNDTTADVLENKLVAGTGVTFTKNNSGANETISVAVNPFSLTESNATATAAQTSFSVTYTAGLIQVFMNGVKLISGSDFTATNGTSVVLSSGAAAGDVLEFVVFGQEQIMTKARQMADLIDNNGDVKLANLDNVAAFPTNWDATLDGSDMVFRYNSTEVFKITTGGAVIALDDITAFGTP